MANGVATLLAKESQTRVSIADGPPMKPCEFTFDQHQYYLLRQKKSPARAKMNIAFEEVRRSSHARHARTQSGRYVVAAAEGGNSNVDCRWPQHLKLQQIHYKDVISTNH